MKVRILQIIIFKVTLRTISAIFPQVWDHITKTVFSKYFLLFSTLYSRKSKNMCIWRHKLCNSKTGVGPTCTWSNEPWYNAFCGFKLQIIQCLGNTLHSYRKIGMQHLLVIHKFTGPVISCLPFLYLPETLSKHINCLYWFTF